MIPTVQVKLLQIAIASWRSSFCEINYQTKFVDVATARSGNVIGWRLGKDRIIPDIAIIK